MTEPDAIKVMTDVAIRRKPHTRTEVKTALSVLEPASGSKEIDPKDARRRDEVRKAAAAVPPAVGRVSDR